jgi:hypothetical protein
MALEGSLGLPTDLLIILRGKPLTPFQAIARAQAKPLLEQTANA